MSRQTASLANLLYPDDPSVVKCLLCQEQVFSIPAHLETTHPGITLKDYKHEYEIQHPGIAPPLEGQPFDETKIKVTAKEAAEHPGGREGVHNEKMMKGDLYERRAYREDCEELAQRYWPGREIASLAYLHVQERRARTKLEDLYQKTQNALDTNDQAKHLAEIESRVRLARESLEKARRERLANSADPAVMYETDMSTAEKYVKTHIGEFQHRCGTCTSILTLPCIPHWAFSPLKTEKGLEHPVWSPEMWHLVKLRKMPLWYMSYFLRTSPEGLKWTARRRGEGWPDFIVLEHEEEQLRMVLDSIGLGVEALPEQIESAADEQQSEEPPL